jgi:tRNA(Ile)-lysidine synthase TilS/MesJ
MRKGALNNLAKKLGCNKVAVGHHADDLTDTMLLSLLYEGRLSTFAPKSYLDKMDLTLIRPMIMIREMDVLSYSKQLPVVDSCCPANKKTKREYVKDLVRDIGKDIPNVRDMIFTALIHPERYNLFDKFEEQAETID